MIQMIILFPHVISQNSRVARVQVEYSFVVESQDAPGVAEGKLILSSPEDPRYTEAPWHFSLTPSHSWMDVIFVIPLEISGTKWVGTCPA